MPLPNTPWVAMIVLPLCVFFTTRTASEVALVTLSSVLKGVANLWVDTSITRFSSGCRAVLWEEQDGMTLRGNVGASFSTAFGLRHSFMGTTVFDGHEVLDHGSPEVDAQLPAPAVLPNVREEAVEAGAGRGRSTLAIFGAGETVTFPSCFFFGCGGR